MRLCMGCMEEFNETEKKCPHCGYVPGTQPVEAYHLIPGMVINGKYIVGKAIGYGGFGVTYIGLDQVLNKKVAIKEYLPGEFSTRVPGQTEVTVFSGEKEEQFQKGIEKFVDEAKRLAKFQNLDHIVQIYDAFDENGTAYIVMEYLEGETLKEKLKREGKISVEQALEYAVPVAKALDVVHKESIIHRDIAPDNLFITKDGDIKLLDFGAARTATVGRSRSLSVIVKMGFAPPEQYQSKGNQGSWTDVYALAATIYWMITGVEPQDSMERESQDEVKPPSKMGVKISSGMENALMNAMQLEISDRTRTMSQFVQELEREDTKRNKTTKKKNDTGHWTKPMKIGVGSAAAVVVVLAVLLATGVIGNVGIITGNGRMGYSYVPDLTGVDYDDAVVTIEDIGMTMKQAAYSYSDTMAENLIITQSVSQGTKAEEGETIEVIVSLGKERRLLNNIIGFTPDDVKQTLDGFDYETEEAESELAAGAIVGVKDEDGKDMDLSQEIGIGNTLKLVLSSGAGYSGDEQITVPDVTGKTFDEARELAKQNHLYIQKTEMKASDDVPQGSIISQSIEAGQAGNAGSVIGVVVSSGAIPMVNIANVLDKTEEEAVKALEEQGLVVKTTYEESSLIAKGNVIRTNPQVGEEIKEGSEIEVVVSSGVTVRSTQSSTRSNNNNSTQSKKKSSKKSDSNIKVKKKSDKVNVDW